MTDPEAPQPKPFASASTLGNKQQQVQAWVTQTETQQVIFTAPTTTVSLMLKNFSHKIQSLSFGAWH